MRLIDGDYIDKKLDEAAEGSDGVGRLTFMVLRSWFRTLPTLNLDDLRPKGRWVNWGKSGTPTYENYGTCSVCHEDAEIHTEHRNFCPSCGAKMENGV